MNGFSSRFNTNEAGRDILRLESRTSINSSGLLVLMGMAAFSLLFSLIFLASRLDNATKARQEAAAMAIEDRFAAAPTPAEKHRLSVALPNVLGCVDRHLENIEVKHQEQSEQMGSMIARQCMKTFMGAQ